MKLWNKIRGVGNSKKRQKMDVVSRTVNANLGEINDEIPQEQYVYFGGIEFDMTEIQENNILQLLERVNTRSNDTDLIVQNLPKFGINEQTKDSFTCGNHLNIQPISEIINKNLGADDRDIVSNKQYNYLEETEPEPTVRTEYNAQENDINILKLSKQLDSRSTAHDFDLIGHLMKCEPTQKLDEEMTDCNCPKCKKASNTVLASDKMKVDRYIEGWSIEPSSLTTHMPVEEEATSGNGNFDRNSTTCPEIFYEMKEKQTQHRIFEQTESQAIRNVNSFGNEAARLAHKPLLTRAHVPIKEELGVSENLQKYVEKDIIDSFEEFLINNREFLCKIIEIGNEEDLMPRKRTVHVPIKVPKDEEFKDFVQELKELDFVDSFEEFLIESMNEINENDNLSPHETTETQATITESNEEIRNCIATSGETNSKFGETIHDNLEKDDRFISEDPSELFENTKGEIHLNNKLVEIIDQANDVTLSDDLKPRLPDEIVIDEKNEHYNSFEQLVENIIIAGTKVTTDNNYVLFRETISEFDPLTTIPDEALRCTIHYNLEKGDTFISEDPSELFENTQIIRQANEVTLSDLKAGLTDEIVIDKKNEHYNSFEQLDDNIRITGTKETADDNHLLFRETIAESDLLTTVPDEALMCDILINEENLNMRDKWELGTVKVSGTLGASDQSYFAIDESTECTFIEENSDHMEPSKETQFCSNLTENIASQEEIMTRHHQKVETTVQSQTHCDIDEFVLQGITVEDTEVNIHRELTEEIAIESRENNGHLHVVEVTDSTLSIADIQVETETTNNNLEKFVRIDVSPENQMENENFVPNEEISESTFVGSVPVSAGKELRNDILEKASEDVIDDKIEIIEDKIKVKTETTNNNLEKFVRINVSPEKQIENENFVPNEEVSESTFVGSIPANASEAVIVDDKIAIIEDKVQADNDYTVFDLIDERGERYIVIDECLGSSIIEETQDERTDHEVEKDGSVDKLKGPRKRLSDHHSEEAGPSAKIIKLEVTESEKNVDNACIKQAVSDGFVKKTVETIIIDSDSDEETPDAIMIPDGDESEQLTKESPKRKCDNIEEHAPNAKIAKVVQKPAKPKALASRAITRSQRNPALTRVILANPMTSTWHFTTHRPYVLWNLTEQTPEFERVRKIFKRTATRRMAICNIYRVENPYLLGMYLMKKEKMERTCDQVVERELFHGTREENIDGICRYNFDWRRRGQSRGHKFGQGVSFSPKASYARHYNFGDDVMFLARVLVSRMMEGNCETVMPPEPYDTTRNHTGDVIVKYNDDDFYPQYLIYYYYKPGCGFFFGC